MSRFAKVTVLKKKLSEAGVCGYWYATYFISRLERQGKARLPRTDSGRLKMTEKQMDEFVLAFSPGGRMKYP